MNWEIAIDVCALPCVKEIASRNPLYSAGAQLGALWCPRWVGWGRLGGRSIREGIYIYIHIADSLRSTAGTNTTL